MNLSLLPASTFAPASGAFRTCAMLLCVAALLFAWPVAAQAQSIGERLANLPSDEEATARVDEMMSALSQELGLTDAQAQNLQLILVQNAHERLAMLRGFREEHGTDPGFFAKRSLRRDMKKVNEKSQQRLSGVLSAEQLETYERFAKERREAQEDDA